MAVAGVEEIRSTIAEEEYGGVVVLVVVVVVVVVGVATVSVAIGEQGGDILRCIKPNDILANVKEKERERERER